jgi:hypothetical protein
MSRSARDVEIEAMLRCKQVTTLVASDGLAEAGLWLRLKVRLHLLMCRHCARYAAQIRTIDAKVRERFHSSKEQPAVEELQRKILESAGKSNDERNRS